MAKAAHAVHHKLLAAGMARVPRPDVSRYAASAPQATLRDVLGDEDDDGMPALAADDTSRLPPMRGFPLHTSATAAAAAAGDAGAEAGRSGSGAPPRRAGAPLVRDRVVEHWVPPQLPSAPAAAATAGAGAGTVVTAAAAAATAAPTASLFARRRAAAASGTTTAGDVPATGFPTAPHRGTPDASGDGAALAAARARRLAAAAAAAAVAVAEPATAARDVWPASDAYQLASRLRCSVFSMPTSVTVLPVPGGP